MNVTCDKCNKRYSIADDKVRGKSVKIRCKQCQNLISVQGPSSGSEGVQLAVAPAAVSPSPWEDERTRAAPAMDNSAQWFAMVKGKQLGPFDPKGLEARVKTGELTLRTYLWKQGMGDWKRASDVPEVSSVFAGVSVGATATASSASSTLSQPPVSKRAPAVQRDVAVALEMPSPEITGKKPNGNGHAEPLPPPIKATSSARIPAVAKSPEPLPVLPNDIPDADPTAPAPVPTAKANAPLSDLFGGDMPAPSGPAEAGPMGDLAADSNANKEEADPFAALGEADPAMAPAPGEATKFFIAQAGVNKRNPPWKIALFVLGAPAGIIGILFLLSSLHIVPLEVTRTNEQGEEVKESFFSPGGVSGIKDLFSGEAAKRKAEAEKTKQAAADRKRREALANRPDRPVENKPDNAPDKPAEVKPVDPALALIYGNGVEKESKGPRVRLEDRKNQAATDSSGLSQEASQKVIGDKIKAFEGCVEQALRRNPNLAVGPIEVVLNVGASGAVTSSSILPAKHNNSEWGQCMRDVAKRIVFPKSDGETEVSLPLKVGVALSP